LSLNILVHNNILVSSLGNSKHQSTSEVVIEQEKMLQLHAVTRETMISK
jgi:hypothetical protein